MLPELYIYRELVKSLTNIKGFNGWFIARLELKIEKTKLPGNETSGKHIKNQFIKQRKNFSAISAYTIHGNAIYTLIMHIVKPASMPGTDTIKEQPGLFANKNNFTNSAYTNYTYLFNLEYNIECINKFIENTGDSNIIHQKVQPVVPGFLMFEDIILKMPYKDIIDSSKTRYVMVFRKPVIAGEEIEVYKLDNANGKIIALPAGSLKNIYGTGNTKWEFLWRKHI